MDKPIACVTGASGTVGSWIVKDLLLQNYKVRVLSRKAYPVISNVEVFKGNINDDPLLKEFIQGAQLFFHCAAELKDESKMWPVNVMGTEKILKYAELYGVKYFCHLSSVGVIGATNKKLADEDTPCNPQNIYEKSKWAAEKMVARGIKDCKVVILRPTDVIDENKPGVLELPKRSSFIDFCKVFIKGSECAYIVHARDVSAAAVHFISYPITTPQCYIISCDNEPLNTLAGAWMFYKSCLAGNVDHYLRSIPHLPLWVPYLLRKMIRRKGNMGDIRYSPEKLLKTGFTYKLGFKGAVRQIASTCRGYK